MKYRNNIINDVKRLRREFPLQARVEAIDVATCDAYTSVLSAWIQDGVAPQPDIIPKMKFEKLLALDTIVMTNSGLGCYPFSAEKTGINVEFREHHVYAMSAIDAFAISFLTESEIIIQSRCSKCALPLTIKTDELGQIKEALPAGTQVEYRQVSTEHTACCNDLFPGITFICATCAAIAIRQSDLISLEEASVVGRVFYYFQSCLINPPDLKNQNKNAA